MRQFEIPYNFDKHLIKLLHNIDPSGESYHCIYMSPHINDYHAAKRFTRNTLFNNKSMVELQNFTFEHYLEHVNNIINVFGKNKLMLLLQQNEYCMETSILIKYINLGFSKFCVGSIEQAKAIKQLMPNAEITGSITMKIMPNMLISNPEYSIFNNFVLWFPYNRNLNLIQQLPKDYNYILLVNCSCNKNCNGTQHWLAKTQEEEDTIICPNKNNKISIQDTILIPPGDLQLFDNYITYYKLQGREYSTYQLIQDVCMYKSDIHTTSTINYFN